MEVNRKSMSKNDLSQDKLLILDLNDQHVSVNYEQPSITLGRDTGNRIVINHPKASRHHARIEMKEDQFILLDRSTNGTHIHPKDAKARVIHNEAFVLRGSGTIYLGKAAPSDSPGAIRYEIL